MDQISFLDGSYADVSLGCKVLYSYILRFTTLLDFYLR